MKKILIFGIFLYISLQINAKAIYYYYNGERVPISVSDDSIRVYSLDKIETNHDGKNEFAFSSRILPSNYNRGNAEAGSLYAYAGEYTAELIDKDCGKSFALNILGNNNKLAACVHNLLKKRKNILYG